MLNSIVNPKKEYVNEDHSGSIEVSDYFSLELDNIRSLYHNPSLLEYIKLQFNDLIENIAYKLYNDPKYYDILMLLNQRDMLFDMVYTFDTIKDIVEEETNNYFNDYQGKTSPEFLQSYKKYKLEEYEKNNEKLNTLLVLKKDVLPEIIRNYIYGI